MIAIIDYNSGNIASIQNALACLGVDSFVSADPGEIIKADKIIFPGVGRAGVAMKELRKRGLDKFIPTITKPFLGICLGLQLLAEFSEEDNMSCLGIIPGRVLKFPSSLKVPQIGWNQVALQSLLPLTKNIPNNSYFYFVNSYYLEYLPKFTIGETNYGVPFSAVIQKNNFYATQFHPEKSGAIGQQILKNFCEL